MPRRTALEFCVRCKKRAELGVYTGYYRLSSKPRLGQEGNKRQVRGTLPARGFCMDCFLRYAKGQGWDRTVMQKLRSRLRPL